VKKELINGQLVAAVMLSFVEHPKWRVGLTQNLAERHSAWDQPKSFKCWQADSLEDAQALEASLIAAGMKGGTGGNMEPGKPTWIYVFIEDETLEEAQAIAAALR